MGTDVKLSSEFTIIYGGEVIAYCTDFTLEKNKEIIDITKLGDTWKNKKVDTKDFNVSFNGMITRGDTVTASLWDPTTAYSSGDYVVLAGKAWEAQGSTTGDNPTTDDGTNWIETSAWSSGTTYAAGDMVYITSVAQETRIYKSLQGSNLNQDPLTETAYWERLETNYELLLKELQNNDTEVLCTIKPSTTGETYYYGNGRLTSLSASITQGDKATFSGSFEGSGSLSYVSDPYGPELHTDANAASDPNGNEADATTGFTPQYLTGTGANVFESQGSVVNEGSYAIHADSTDTPTQGAGFSIQFTGLENGATYDIDFYWRHTGTGAISWRHLYNSGGGLISQNTIQTTTTTFTNNNYQVVMTGTTLTLTWQTAATPYNGGIYLDNLSVRKVL
jgi:hypothetical protein